MTAAAEAVALTLAVEGETVTIDAEGRCTIRGVELEILRDLRLARAALRRVQSSLRRWNERDPHIELNPRANELRGDVEELELGKVVEAMTFVDDWPSVDRLERIETHARARWNARNGVPDGD